MQDVEKKRRIRRTVITLVVVAVSLYALFIFYTYSMVPHGQHP